MPSKFCKIQKVEDCRVPVSETRAALWIRCSNAGAVAKETGHIRAHSRTAVFYSAGFFAADHRLVATFKLHIKSRIPRCNHTVFHYEKLKDWVCAHKYAVTVSNHFNVLSKVVYV